MTDPAILFVKPGAISKTDKRSLTEAGVIVVEVENVADVKLVRAHSELSGGELLVAAAQALSDTQYSVHHLTAFGKAVCAAIQAKEPRP